MAHQDPAVIRRAHGWLAVLGGAVTVSGATDLDSARALYAELEPQVVVLSSSLCRREGGRLLSEIKRGPRGADTAVILVERSLSLEAARVELGKGAYDFLFEPLRPAELVARVQAAARAVDLQGEIIGQARRVESLVYSDALTGLHNRRFMLSQLRALISGAQRHQRPISVVLLDLDHFKAVNDEHGHDAGDRTLIAIGQALKDRLRAEDYVGRMGGEEFLVLLPDTGEEEAVAVAESLRRCVAEAEIPTSAGAVIRVTASAGWATWHGEEPEALVRRADHALYAAKAAGRDLVRGG